MMLPGEWDAINKAGRMGCFRMFSDGCILNHALAASVTKKMICHSLFHN